MIFKWGKGDKFSIHIFFVWIGLLVPGLVQAGPVGLPDSARPGAVRPEEEDKLDLPKPPPSSVMEVPAVIDRPFDVDECPCTLVKEFRLLNAEDMPQFEVKLDEVNLILDENIQEQAESGFSIGQLQEVANQVRNYYREKGLILTQVVVPVQTIENGVVDLELYIGKLGRVLAEGNKMFPTELLSSVFEDLIGKPIHKSDIEAALLRLTDYPGLTVFGVFQPGLLVGTADIVLKVQEEKHFDVAMRIDNHGTRETGLNRFRTVIDWNSPTKGPDRLTLSIQQAYNPKNNVYKGVDYERYLGDSSYLLKAFLNRNKFDVGGEFKVNQIHSETENAGISIEKSFIRSRVRNFSTNFGVTKKKSETTTAHKPTNEDRLSVFTLGMDYDSVDTFSPFRIFTDEKTTGGGINFASLDFSHGVNDIFGAMGSAHDAEARPNGFRPSRQGGPPQNEFAAGMFTKLFGTYTRLQTVKSGVSLLFRSEMQWSDDILVPVEQYSVGGPENVRGYPVAQILWDKALFYSFELLFNAPFIADKPAFGNRTWGELLQLGIFYDYAIGKVNAPGVDEKDGYEDYKSYGFGFRFNYPGSIESRIFWAWAFGGDEIGKEEAPGDKSDDKRPAIWGDLTYSF